jgi:hypothetical protein
MFVPIEIIGALVTGVFTLIAAWIIVNHRNKKNNP